MKNNKGCNKEHFYDGTKYWKCGETYYGGNPLFCDKCKLKNLGVKVGAKFYQINYIYGRLTYEFEVLKLNDKSVRVRCTFLDGRQSPQEYAIENEKAVGRFERYSKTFSDAVKKAIEANSKAIKQFQSDIKLLPKKINTCRLEIKDLKRLKND